MKDASDVNPTGCEGLQLVGETIKNILYEYDNILDNILLNNSKCVSDFTVRKICKHFKINKIRDMQINSKDILYFIVNSILLF